MSATLKADELRILRRDIQIIFQDPYASLNPRMNVGAIVGEALIIHQLTKTQQQFEERVVDLLETVGLRADHMARYPERILRRPAPAHRHRAGAGGRAQADHLRRAGVGAGRVDPGPGHQPAGRSAGKFGLAYLFIAHDLAVVEHISKRIAVMYLGRIVEMASAHELYATPRHPYTEALLSAVPIPDPKVKRQRIRLRAKCRARSRRRPAAIFTHRCPIAQFPLCKSEAPPLKQSDDGHWVACHFR